MERYLWIKGDDDCDDSESSDDEDSELRMVESPDL